MSSPQNLQRHQFLPVEAWRKATPQEHIAYLKSKHQKSNSQLLAIRRKLKPVDMYAYLRARFQEPNGIQNTLRSDDSDNIIHWDYHLKSENDDIYICGHLREVHIVLSHPLTDAGWLNLFNALKDDFKRVRKEKSEIQKSFEKYFVFQNRFTALADVCADLHEKISTLKRPSLVDYSLESENELDRTALEKEIADDSEYVRSLFGYCLQLRLIMPILAESYINMIILVFCRDQTRNDRASYEKLLRTGIVSKIQSLHIYCRGFDNEVKQNTPGFKEFLSIFNRRNYELHGNIDPDRERLETVYFEGKRPLYVTSGNSIDLLHQHLERYADPNSLLQEYENLHMFLYEVSCCMNEQARTYFDQIVSDPFPGYKVDARRPTRLFSDYLVWATYPGIRYDEDLSELLSDTPDTAQENAEADTDRRSENVPLM